MAHLNTLQGTLHPEEMGFTAVHEHLLAGPPGWELDPGAWFKIAKAFDKCYSDLMDFKLQGGQTFVDCSGVGEGRELDFNIKLAASTGVHLVASTGFGSELATPPHFRERDAHFFEALFVRELTEGMGRTGVKAGLISIGNGSGGMSELEQKQFVAAVRAAKQTGVALLTRGIAGAGNKLSILRKEGLNPARVIFGGCDESIDIERDKGIALSGSYVAYDNVGLESWSSQPHAMPDARRVQLVQAMIEAGHLERVLVSAGSKAWVLGRGEAHLSNVGNVLRYFVPRLLESGVSDDAVRGIFVHNPKRVLPVQP